MVCSFPALGFFTQFLPWQKSPSQNTTTLAREKAVSALHQGRRR